MSMTLTMSRPAPAHTLNRRQHNRAASATMYRSTPTPGMLVRVAPAQQQPTKAKQPTHRASPKPKQAVAPLTALKPSPEITDKRTSSSASPRGRRSQEKPKDRPETRSSSSTSVNGGLRRSRQPSPPIELPTSQAEVLQHLDPFTDNQTQGPVQLRTPSGRLAKSRQPHGLPTPPSTSPSSPINVPMASKKNQSPRREMTRSDSFPVTMLPRKLQGGSSNLIFPICDDDDKEDTSDAEAVSLPTTPTKSKTVVPESGPLSAPLFSSYFPLSPSASPKARSRPVHKRSPSEGAITELSGDGNFVDITKVLAGMSFANGDMSETEQDKQIAAVLAGFYASSSFQNSPGPVDMPPPAF